MTWIRFAYHSATAPLDVPWLTRVTSQSLVSDCETLPENDLGITLAAYAILRLVGRHWTCAWWDGITLDGTPERGTQLRLIRRGLTGALASELGSLTNLGDAGALGRPVDWLRSWSEQSSLANLQELSLSHHQLTGGIPSELSSVTNLLTL